MKRLNIEHNCPVGTVQVLSLLMHTLKLAHMPERDTASGIYHVSAAGQFFFGQ